MDLLVLVMYEDVEFLEGDQESVQQQNGEEIVLWEHLTVRHVGPHHISRPNVREIHRLLKAIVDRGAVG